MARYTTAPPRVLTAAALAALLLTVLGLGTLMIALASPATPPFPWVMP